MSNHSNRLLKLMFFDLEFSDMQGKYRYALRLLPHKTSHLKCYLSTDMCLANKPRTSHSN